MKLLQFSMRVVTFRWLLVSSREKKNISCTVFSIMRLILFFKQNPLYWEKNKENLTDLVTLCWIYNRMVFMNSKWNNARLPHRVSFREAISKASKFRTSKWELPWTPKRLKPRSTQFHPVVLGFRFHAAGRTEGQRDMRKFHLSHICLS